MKLVLIAVGGAAGALLRYGASVLIPRATTTDFPWATLSVNLIGSLGGLAARIVIPTNLHAFILIGMLGAFTTFSTYMIENLQFLHGRSVGLFVLYFGASNAAGLLLVFAGFLLGRRIVS